MKRRLCRVFIVLMCVLWSVPAFAQTAPEISDDRVNAVAAQMFCTECENIPLDVCGTQACIQWREEIRTQLAEGRSTEEILAYFRENYGEHALAVPTDPALRGLSLYTPLVLAVLIALGGAFFLLRQRTVPTESTAHETTPPDAAAYLQQLQQDLERGE